MAVALVADPATEALAGRVATFLEQRCEELVVRWIDWLRARLDTGAVRVLPDDALRNHIPPVLIAIARYVRTPLEAARRDLLGHLQLHGHLRWEQGYDIEELLAEFDGLATLVTDAVKEELSDMGEKVEASALIETLARVTTGLRSIGYVTVSVYREAEASHRREVARHLEEFASSVAHELRGPLHTIGLGADLLAGAETPSDDEQRERHIAIIRRSLSRMSDLVDNIQILALAEGALSGDEAAPLPDIVSRVTDELRPLAERRGVVVRVAGERLPDVHVQSLVAQLALTNVISNAIKYSDVDAVERYAELRADVRGREGAAPLCVVVIEDNGIGVPTELRESVFRRGVRAHPDVSEGTGLGLFTVRRLVQQIGGSIELEGGPDGGTRVRLLLPVLEGPSSALSASEQQPRQPVALSSELPDQEDGQAL